MNLYCAIIIFDDQTEPRKKKKSFSFVWRETVKSRKKNDCEKRFKWLAEDDNSLGWLTIKHVKLTPFTI